MSIEDENAELRNAPHYPVEINRHNRCHICGQIEANLYRFDTHLLGIERYACGDCNPNRGTW